MAYRYRTHFGSKLETGARLSHGLVDRCEYSSTGVCPGHVAQRDGPDIMKETTPRLCGKRNVVLLARDKRREPLRDRFHLANHVTPCVSRSLGHRDPGRTPTSASAFALLVQPRR